MDRYSPKIEIINHFDDLICQLDIDTEECLEKHEGELLEERIRFKNGNLGNDYRFQIRFVDYSQQEREEEIAELWPESTKVTDYLSEIRMRKIEQFRTEQKEWVEKSSQFKHLRVAVTDEKKREELKSQLFAEKFYFQVKITKPAYKRWFFNLITFVTDFYVSQAEINILEKLINSERNEIKRLSRDSKFELEKMVQLRLLYKYFWDNFTTRAFPNHTIYVFKQDLSNLMNEVKQIKLKYPISGVNLNGFSTSLWKLKHLDLDIIDGRLEEVNIENLPYLQYLRLKSVSVERITLNSLNALRRVFLYINDLQTDLQADLCDQIPNIEKLTVKLDSFSFEYVKAENKLSICLRSINDIDFSPFYPITNEIEKLHITDSNIDSGKLIRVFRHFRNVSDLSICESDITQIENGTFDGLPNLRSLSLHYNRDLETIDYDAFANLKQLEHLSLSHNFIQSLDNRVFSYLVSLETLNLIENGIESLDENIFSSLENLRHLYLGSNKYELLDHRLFVGLGNLIELHLPGCVLTNFDLRILDNLPRLEKILLSKMSIMHNETVILSRFYQSGIDFQFYI